MFHEATWNLKKLSECQGRCLLLGDGAVAVVYELCGAGRVRAKFYLYEAGSFMAVAAEVNRASKLVALLNIYEDTDNLARRYGLKAPNRGMSREHPHPGSTVETAALPAGTPDAAGDIHCATTVLIPPSPPERTGGSQAGSRCGSLAAPKDAGGGIMPPDHS